jgi:predicted dehydrogenase
VAELRFAVIGAGFWAHYQLAAWGEAPGVRCVAVCDQDRQKAETLAAARSVPRAYDDVSEMLRTERPDFVDVITDPASHAAMVRLVAEAGIPVICQKPMTPTLAESEDLVDACRAAGVPFAIHENWRWQAPLRRVKELLAEGAIGRPFRARIDFLSGFDVFANQPGLRRDERFILADMGCHLLDLARCYFGEAESVYCRTARVRPDIRGEDSATVVLTMDGGKATVVVNMAYAGTPLERECFPETLVFIEGECGSMEAAPGCDIRVTTAAGTRSTRVLPPEYPWANPDYAVVHSSMVACQADLLRALRTGTPAETDAADNLKTMRLVEVAYESVASGEAIRLSK